MIDLNQIFRAGRVRRWHANSDLSWTDDYVDGHQGRVARIILALCPDPSATLIAAALTHDDGEWMFGDIPAPGKAAMTPMFRHALNQAESDARQAVWGDKSPSALTEKEYAWLRLADRLDGYMWCLFTMPDVTLRAEWQDAKRGIEALAASLDCVEDVTRVIGSKARVQ